MTPLQKALNAVYAEFELIQFVSDKDLKSAWGSDIPAGWLVKIAQACGVPRTLRTKALAKVTKDALKVYDSKEIRSTIYWANRYVNGTITEEEYDQCLKKNSASCRLPMIKLNEAIAKAGIQHEGAQIVRDVIPFEALRVPE